MHDNDIQHHINLPIIFANLSSLGYEPPINPTILPISLYKRVLFYLLQLKIYVHLYQLAIHIFTNTFTQQLSLSYLTLYYLYLTTFLINLYRDQFVYICLYQ